MIQITNPSDCCGCTACANSCPHNAITMKPDALGFLYPQIDTNNCINCGLCERICAFKTSYDTSLNLNQPLAFAVRHKDMREVETSRSGAAFIALSDYVLEKGGVVYGAGYTDHFRVIHKRATNKEERNEFKGSKYVQSDLGSIFQQVKQDLKKGLLVMFSGTPCQTAGLNSFVGKKLRENLFLVDIVCHGVPGPYIWRDYLSFLEKKYNSPIIQVNFRNKLKFGWAAHYETYIFQKGIEINKHSYTYLFYKHIMFRKSCEKCPYANLQRPSDITLADFWGWEKTNSNLNKDDKGISLLFLNTEKGKSLINLIENKLYITQANLDNCLQGNLRHPSKADPSRDKFEYDYSHKGFKYVYYKYGEDGFRYKAYTIWKKIINKLHI